MAKIRRPEPCLLVIAAFSRHTSALDWAQARLTQLFGPIERISPDFDFHHTTYYTASMGEGLRKRFLVFERLRPSDVLPWTKNLAIGLENELAVSGNYPESRPLNLDPGLLQLGKFLLATTKDQSHRMYLGENVYGEVTLRFHGGKFDPWPWTYADYREPALADFLESARAALYARLIGSIA